MKGLAFSNSKRKDVKEMPAFDPFETQGLIAVPDTEKAGPAGFFHHRRQLRERCSKDVKLVAKTRPKVK
jgi:hypothetical protein